MKLRKIEEKKRGAVCRWRLGKEEKGLRGEKSVKDLWKDSPTVKTKKNTFKGCTIGGGERGGVLWTRCRRTLFIKSVANINQ